MGNIERIEQNLKSATEKEKIGLFIKLSEYYRKTNIKKSIKFAKSSYIISDKLKDISGQIKANNTLGDINARSGNFKEALFYFLKNLKLSKNNNNIRCHLYNNIGLIYYYQCNYGKAIENLNKSLKIATKIKDKEAISSSLGNLGLIYKRISNYDKALNFQIEALKVEKQIQNYPETKIADTLGNIGTLYGSLKFNKKALDYYNRSLEILKKHNDKIGISGQLCNIGTVYLILHEYDKALDYFTKANIIAEELNHLEYIANISYNIGSLYREKNDYNLSIEFLNKSLSINKKLKNKHSISNIQCEISKTYLEIGHIDKSISHLMKSLQISYAINEKELVMENLQTVSNYFFSIGNYEKSLNYFKKYNKLKDEIYNKIALKIIEIQTNFETEEKSRNVEIERCQRELYKLKKIESEVARNQALEEQLKTDKMLMCMLLMKLTNELEEFGYLEPTKYQDVTIMILDNLENSIENTESFKNEVNSKIENILFKYNCTKINTIKNVLVAISGMPTSDKKHAENIVNASLEIIELISDLNKHSKEKLEIKIGVHTGEVVGGIIGNKVYIYDVFEDTIKKVLMLQVKSKPMAVNISLETYKNISGKYKFTKRESIDNDGKTKLIMYEVKKK